MKGIYDLAAGCYTVVTTDQLLAVQRVLWVLGLSAQGLLIVAILQRKLLRAYPFFMAYLVIDLGFSLALIQIPFSHAGLMRRLSVSISHDDGCFT